MSFNEAIAYQRDFIAVKSRVLAAMMPCDRETSSAMQVLLAASQVGTNAVRLAKTNWASYLSSEYVLLRYRCAKRRFGKAIRQMLASE